MRKVFAQRCCNSEPTTGHFDMLVHFQFTGHSLGLSDNVLYDWLFVHHCLWANDTPHHLMIFFYVGKKRNQLGRRRKERERKTC